MTHIGNGRKVQEHLWLLLVVISCQAHFSDVTQVTQVMRRYGSRADPVGLIGRRLLVFCLCSASGYWVCCLSALCARGVSAACLPLSACLVSALCLLRVCALSACLRLILLLFSVYLCSLLTFLFIKLCSSPSISRNVSSLGDCSIVK